MKILVVDDAGFCRANTTQILKNLDHVIIEANSGEDALELLKNDQTIDAVITDLRMAGIDGVELFQESMRLERVNDLGAATPPEFVMLTSFSPGRNAEQRDINRISLAKQIGFTNIFFNPLDTEKFRGSIQQIAENRQGHSTKVNPLRNLSSLMNELQKLIDEVISNKDDDSATELRDEIQPQLDRLQSV